MEAIRLEEVCRACLCSGRTMSSLLKSIAPKLDSQSGVVVQFWKIFTKVLITNEDRYPDQICMKCLDEIQRTYSFIIKCERSEDILKKMKNVQAISVNCDNSENIKSENDMYPNISQIKIENVEWYDEEHGEREQFQIIVYGNVDSEEYSQSQNKLLMQHEKDNLGIEILATQDLKQEPELEVCMTDDEIESQDKSNTEIFKCSACIYECRMMDSLEKHIIKNHVEGHRCKLCNKEFKCTAIEHFSTHLHSMDGVIESTNIKHYNCEVCSKIFRGKSNLNEHLKIHTGEKPFNCDICAKTFRQKHHLTGHLRCHRERPFKCETCGETFRQKTSLKFHSRCHTVVGALFKCEICTKAFRHKNNLTRHLIIHTGERPYKCEICPKDFQQQKYLAEHIRSHKGERPFKCEICSQTFRRKKNLSHHLKCHTEKLVFKCEICPATFRRKNNLSGHLKRHTRLSEKITDSDVNSPVDQTSKYTSIARYEEANLRIEILDHVDDANVTGKDIDLTNQNLNQIPELDICLEKDEFNGIESTVKSNTEIAKCPACSYKCCRLRESPESHIKGEVCKLCNKEFVCSATEHCSIHLHVNSTDENIKLPPNIKQHKCKVCSKIFRLKSNLTRHFMLHTGERPFKCEFCTKTFRQKHHLIGHLKCHTVKPFKCERQGDVFKK